MICLLCVSLRPSAISALNLFDPMFLTLNSASVAVFRAVSLRFASSLGLVAALLPCVFALKSVPKHPPMFQTYIPIRHSRHIIAYRARAANLSGPFAG